MKIFKNTFLLRNAKHRYCFKSLKHFTALMHTSNGMFFFLDFFIYFIFYRYKITLFKTFRFIIFNFELLDSNNYKYFFLHYGDSKTTSKIQIKALKGFIA